MQNKKSTALTAVDEEKFDWKCFLPKISLIFKISSFILILFGLEYFGFFSFISSILPILKKVLHDGAIALVVIYVFYYEVPNLLNFRDRLTKFRIYLKNKLEELDEELDDFIFEDVGEQVSCLSKFLQYVLTLLKVPEKKVKKVKVVKVKKAFAFLIYIPVFIFILLWDIFFKGIAPWFISILGNIFFMASNVVKSLYFYLNIDKFFKKIGLTYLLISFANFIEKNKIIHWMLVIGFVLIFSLMEAVKLYGVAVLAQGEFLIGLGFYLSSFLVLLLVQPYHDKYGNKMREVRWYEVRESGVINLFLWSEQRNAYTRVMSVVSKGKAILKTVYDKIKKLLSVFKLIIAEKVRIIANKVIVTLGFEPIESSTNSILDDIKEIYYHVKKKTFIYFKGETYKDLLVRELYASGQKLDNAISNNLPDYHINALTKRKASCKLAYDSYMFDLYFNKTLYNMITLKEFISFVKILENLEDKLINCESSSKGSFTATRNRALEKYLKFVSKNRNFFDSSFELVEKNK